MIERNSFHLPILSGPVHPLHASQYYSYGNTVSSAPDHPRVYTGQAAARRGYSQLLFDFAQFGLAVGQLDLQVAGGLAGALAIPSAPRLAGTVGRSAGATLRQVLLEDQLHQTL